ncbi:hypothetical protein ARMGADRAFT_1092719 [Armillaria gallica]|uniref:Uncharacterized protein n=1 Tax=Armillaria gallica TaxID=47427 RepID=A0A2H3CDA5_ARMGA|nr:hypothetical protein ARMGADRAFT_1092719 [Armillaria gallica]
MQTLLRSRLSFLVLRVAKPSIRPLITRTPFPQRRTYAKKAQSTSSLQPGSQQPLTKPTDIVEHDEKRSVELEVFQDLLDKYVAEIDKILVDMKKTLGVSR